MCTQQALSKGSDLLERSSKQIRKLPARAFDFKRCQRSKADGERIYHQEFSLIAQLVKEFACNAGDPGSIPGSGRPAGEGTGCCCCCYLACPTLCNPRQPTRLPRPWDSPGKNTGVGCHFLLQCMKVKSESEVAQLCPALSNPMDCSPPGSSIHGIFPGKSTAVGCHCYPLHYSWASLAAQLVKNPHAMWETWVPSLGWEDPLEIGKATHSSILALRIPWTV